MNRRDKSIPAAARPQPSAPSPADALAMRQDEALLGVSAQDHDGKRIDPASIVVVMGVDQHGAPVVETMTVRPVAWWNNIRRAWMVTGPDGQPVLADPQPPPPVFGTSISFPDVPPAVKVMT